MATTVMAGPSCAFMVEDRAGPLRPLPPSDPKLGNVTIVLPPRTSTPGTAGEPVGALPAPPGPGVGEMPPRAVESEPWPASDLPVPEPSAVRPLPGPLPCPMLAPPPRPPRPGLSPPEGDMARAPFAPLPGMPTAEPG